MQGAYAKKRTDNIETPEMPGDKPKSNDKEEDCADQQMQKAETIAREVEDVEDDDSQSLARKKTVWHSGCKKQEGELRKLNVRETMARRSYMDRLT